VASNKHSLTAIIYDKKGKVLSVGQNSYIKTHPLMARYASKVGEPARIYLHAEIHAITKCKDLKRAYSIFVSRYNKQGQPVNAQPCRICQEALLKVGIKEIIHT
jgi:tRNA(Arg) A34 adenosine deaminase TadA